MSLVDKVEHYKERYASVRDSYKDVVKQLKTNREYVQRLEFENRNLKRDVEVLNDEIRFLHSTKLSEDRKNKIVNSLVARSKASTEHPMLDIVLYSVCEYFEVTKGELQSKKRSRKLYLPRQVAHYLLSDRFAGLYIPLTAIGDNPFRDFVHNDLHKNGIQITDALENTKSSPVIASAYDTFHLPLTL